MASLNTVYVDNAQSLDSAVTTYIVKGYTVANRTPTVVTLQKAKKFSIIWLLVGLLFFGIGLVLYMIYYVTQPAVRVVEIKVRPA